MPSDLLVRAIAPTDELRIVAAVTTELSREAARRHDLSPAATAALARGLTSGLLLATMTKGEERVTVQLTGDGPLGGLTVDANAAGEVRGYVRNPRADIELPPGRIDLSTVLGRNGVVNITRDLGLRDLYQGQIELVTGEIDEDVEAYLRSSEQVSSAMSCEVVLDGEGRILRAAGILIQALPGGEAAAVGRAQHQLRTGALYDLLALGDHAARAIAEQLTPSLPLEFLTDRPVRFQCRCSEERIRVTLQMLSVEDLEEMIAEDKPAEVTCNFCNTRYEIGVDELRAIRDQRVEPGAAN